MSLPGAEARLVWLLRSVELPLDLAFGYEALARAFAVAADTGAARKWSDQAPATAEAIAGDEDRDLLPTWIPFPASTATGELADSRIGAVSTSQQNVRHG